jgi:Fe-S-cluster-containing hydrogenase component 2
MTRHPDAGDQGHPLQSLESLRRTCDGSDEIPGDAERCIECNACVTACKNEHEVPWGINRRRVVTINDGKPGERSISVACMHCSDAPCIAVCPVDCIYQTDEGVVLHSKDLCIGCGYCFYACPFGAPQYPQVGNFGTRGKMDKCTFCNGGPEGPFRRRVQEVRPQPSGRGQAAAVRGNVLDQGTAGGDGDVRCPTSIASASWPAASAPAPGAGARPIRAADRRTLPSRDT